MKDQAPHRLSVFTRSLKKIIMPGAIAVAVVLGMIAFFWIPSQTVLVVRTVKPEKTVLCARMTESEEWMISYTHSVNRRPVEDFLRIEGSGLRILRSVFDAFGAGIPETSTAENPLRFLADGRLEYTVNRPVADVTVFVGRVAGHVLHLKGREIPFTTLAEPGMALRFFVEKRSLYQTFKGECLW
jgi:hypothetical protein